MATFKDEPAEEALAERTVIQLSPHAAQAFSDALAQPAKVNERLVAALDRPRGFRWADRSQTASGT